MATIEVAGPALERGEEILTAEALEFVAGLQRAFGARRDQLLTARAGRRAEISRTGRLDFLAETVDVRTGDWTVAPAPADLLDRRVEITGPTERKMAINALNSGARVWLADLEDANTPHWHNVVGGQVNLYDATRRVIEFTSPEGKHYSLRDPDRIPVILPRPRGWHMDEAHLTIEGRPVVAAFADFGLYFFHNAAELLDRGTGPYFYLPKMESHLEARLWNDVFTHAEAELGIDHGTIRATVLIETIRNAVTMNAPMLKAYSDLLVKTCHRRRAFAMGGMAAFIPSRRDAAVNEAAFAKVREDKHREADAGFDGSWVAHPDLVPVCAEIFGEVLSGDNQVDRQRDDVDVSADDLLAIDQTPGDRTEQGLRDNINVGITYLAAWLSGNGAAAINNLMEDAATAEISRSQIWQWAHHGATLDTGATVDKALVEGMVAEEYAALVEAGAYADHLATARDLFEQTALDDDFEDFLTLPAYAAVLAAGG